MYRGPLERLKLIREPEIVGYMGHGLIYCKECMLRDMTHNDAITEGYVDILEGTEMDEKPECDECGEVIEGIIVTDMEDENDEDTYDEDDDDTEY